MLRLLLLPVFAFVVSITPAHAGQGRLQFNFDQHVTQQLREHGVKLVVVDFGAQHCKACVAEFPRWRALKARWRRQGIRFVAVRVEDGHNDTQRWGWPDVETWDDQGGIADQWAIDGLPRAFVWNWRGELVAQQARLDEAARSITRFMEVENLRVIVEAAGDSVSSSTLRGWVEDALTDQGKFQVVIDETRREALKREQRNSEAPGRKDCQRIRRGQAISPNNLVRVTQNGHRLRIALESIGQGCTTHGVSDEFKNGRDGIRTLVKRLSRELLDKLQLPPRSPAGAGYASGAGGRGTGGTQFISQPPGATVMVDGRVVCQAAPCTRQVRSGSHQVTMTLPGYVPLKERVALTAGQIVGWTLVPSVGTLFVRSQPPGEVVIIDGQVRGPTPYENFALPAGRHTIVVEGECYHTEKREVMVTPGKSHTVDVPLEARRATLRIVALDAAGHELKTRVYIDGLMVGRTPKTFSVSLCAREVVLKHGKLGSWHSTLALRERRENNIEAKLGGGGKGSGGPWFTHVQAGSFMMGSPESVQLRDGDEAPAHRVTLTRSFALQTTEVTQGQWLSLMGENPSKFRACGDSCPVEMVSWWDAAAYLNALSRRKGLPECYRMQGCVGRPGDGKYQCSHVTVTSRSGSSLDCGGYRFPTEAEWEYAARAGAKSAGVGGLANRAWHSENAGGTTHPVALKEPNAWGLHDMLGNVWEWTWDRYGAYYGEPTSDPEGALRGGRRVARGCGWTNAARFCRAANRDKNWVQDTSKVGRSEGLGFRCAQSVSNRAR